MKYKFIREHDEQHSIEKMCQTLEVSRGGYYAWQQQPYGPRLMTEAQLANRIRDIYWRHKRRYGSPRIAAQLRREGRKASRRQVAELLAVLGLQAKGRRKFKHTTDSAHRRPVSPNLVGRYPVVTAPNQIWVGDITYIPTGEGWLYLAAVVDLYSRLIVGWAMGTRLHTSLVVAALTSGLLRRGCVAPLIFHSDRGSQYASLEYQRLLAKHQIFGSMSGKGNCYDNAWAESIFHTLKVELVHDERYTTRAQARTSIFEYMEVYYNRQRLHSSIGDMPPVEYEQMVQAGPAATAFTRPEDWGCLDMARPEIVAHIASGAHILAAARC